MPDGATRGDPGVLDEAYDRLARTDFEQPNGFVNHGPMAVEALHALALDDQVDSWARRIVDMIGEGPEPAAPVSLGSGAWSDGLGDYRLLPEWIGLFDRDITEWGWATVVEVWVPRLMPALSTALFHGAIRTAHAVRAIDAVDTPARRAELARALGYWAARYRPGPVPEASGRSESVDDGVLAAAGGGARHYVEEPTIFALHGVTGAMAVDLLIPHLDPDAAAAALAQLRADHAALYGDAPAPAPGETWLTGWEDATPMAAAASGDPHQVKLVEACRRGWEVAGDPAFPEAARTVTARSRRREAADAR
jgi:hypothetical protein